ncbi:helix-turn-helix transcriptional regulator [Streptomyces sp. BE20]|uniref:helix-turn-helix domain-containing protein n=1 Tax=Streptomyces sp. BE20 TaxID=3002525 RepID=UPI002E7791D0|nr:helix-turn-helix transcriptional regulator [Streptomyces sp. BE20]MEE1826473.1 helix-turn-helix transcriptional regulator [Streptomyces sp. BE20]
MGLRGEISQRQRRFGDELRRLRSAAGLSAPEAGALVGMKSPAVSHTEAGRISLNQERLSVWLDAYGCEDPAYRAGLADMGRGSGKGWWSAFANKVPDLALDLAELEDRSVRLDGYDTLYIAGLLQLPAYAETIYEDAYKVGASWDISTAVDFRMQRQRILTDGKDRQFRFVIHEAALRMRFAGDAVMRAQLRHLLDVAELPNVTIQVLPFTAPKHGPISASFLVCDPGCSDLSTIVLSGPKRAEHLGDPTDVGDYRHAFQRLADNALPAVDGRRDLCELPSRDSWGLVQHLLYLLQT